MNRSMPHSRLFAASLAGLAVFLISSLAVWKMSEDTLMSNSTLIDWTKLAMRRVHVVLLTRVYEGRPLPQSLREISPELAGQSVSHNSNVQLVRDGLPTDGWGNPIQYSVRGTSYTLTSYGRDGKPGGTGPFDGDRYLSNDATQYPGLGDPYVRDPRMPSLRQFLFKLPSSGMILSCALSGLIAFCATLLTVRPDRITRRNALALCIKTAVTLGTTIVFAIIIMQLHIPTNH